MDSCAIDAAASRAASRTLEYLRQRLTVLQAQHDPMLIQLGADGYARYWATCRSGIQADEWLATAFAAERRQFEAAYVAEIQRLIVGDREADLVAAD